MACISGPGYYDSTLSKLKFCYKCMKKFFRCTSRKCYRVTINGHVIWCGLTFIRNCYSQQWTGPTGILFTDCNSLVAHIMLCMFAWVKSCFSYYMFSSCRLLVSLAFMFRYIYAFSTGTCDLNQMSMYVAYVCMYVCVYRIVAGAYRTAVRV